MAEVKYTPAQRRAASARKRAAAIAKRSAMTEADALELLGDSVEGGVVTMSSGREMPWAEFFPAWQRGELLLNC